MILKFKKNKQGQATPVSMILVLTIVITLVIITYTWGKGLLDTQETRTTVIYMQSKLLRIRDSVIEVSHERVNSTRIVQITLPHGKLAIVNGSSCIGNAINRNAVLFNITTDNKLIEAENWIVIDPTESDKGCTVEYKNNSAGILLGKATPVATYYVNTYMMWFRTLQEDSTNHTINITTGTVREVSGGTSTLVIQNRGTTKVGNNVYTQVLIEIY